MGNKQLAVSSDIFECDSCGYEVGGYTKKELLQEGWGWHATVKNAPDFVMCGDCEHDYEQRRNRDAA